MPTIFFASALFAALPAVTALGESGFSMVNIEAVSYSHGEGDPSSNLDPASCRELARQLSALKEAGKTIVIAEHRLYYLDGLIDRAVYLKDGAVSHEWGAGEFAALPAERRSSPGLRSLSLKALLPAGRRPAPASPGLRVSGLEAGCHGSRGNVLKGLSFEAAPGEIIGVIGKNGAGKSSLARVLCGLHRESAGEIRLGGKVLPPAKRAGRFYLVMQESSCQLFTDSVENELYLSKDRESRPSGAKVEAVMESLGRQGRIVFVITHDYELLLAACGRVMALEDGRIAADMDLGPSSPAPIRDLWMWK
jgi:energy-coupling factor transport system ATP-binding protein